MLKGSSSCYQAKERHWEGVVRGWLGSNRHGDGWGGDCLGNEVLGKRSCVRESRRKTGDCECRSVHGEGGARG
jgi:hypothetical protein